MTRRDYAMELKAADLRLETPRMTGYRVGMSSSSMIASKLGRLYDIPADTPREIGNILQVLDRKAAQEG